MNATPNDELNNELDYDLEITRITGRHSGGGTWVSGTVDGEYRFEALVFPEHADNPEWEIGESKISKLWIARIKNKEQVFNWDRGPDHPAATKKTQAVIDFLAGGLADYIYAE
jgi:hypothetical protein